MNMSRRLFFSLLLVRPRQSVSLRVAVLETFAMNGKVSAILVNHAEPLERDQFARWLQAHPRSVVRIRNNAGQETAGSIFRVRMCFGRGLVLLDQPITVREKEVLTLITKAWALSQWSKMRPSMGITYIEGTVTGPAGSQTLDFLVDSGAAYSLLPYDIWTAVGLAPKRTLSFALGDGSRIERNVSECHIAFSMGDGYSPVILGEPGDSALLGVVTLENLGLVCNPFSRTLHPMKLLLA